MNAEVDFRAFREMRDAMLSAAVMADARGDTAYADGNRAAAADLMCQVPPPVILPDADKLSEQRAQAHALAMAGAYRTRVPFAVVCRQGDYARRLDALAAQRGQE